MQIKESHQLKNNVPDVHWFQLQGTKASLTAVNSNEEIDGEKKLMQAIVDLIHAYNLIYEDVSYYLFLINNKI